MLNFPLLFFLLIVCVKLSGFANKPIIQSTSPLDKVNLLKPMGAGADTAVQPWGGEKRSGSSCSTIVLAKARR